MAAVRLMPPPRQDFALRDWLFPGVVLALSMVLLPVLGKDVDFLKSLFGSGYTLSLSLVLGVAFTAYCAFFIATHLAGVPGLSRETRPHAVARAPTLTRLL